MTHYPFTKLSDLSFEFRTAKGLLYSAYFLEYGFMFDGYPAFSRNIFSFNLDLISGELIQSFSDDRIGSTVVEILKSFILLKENVVLYICDNLDDRHLSRKRKFDFWFWKFDDGEIIKEDGLAVIDGVEIYNSILIHKKNERMNEIIQAFRELNQKASNK